MPARSKYRSGTAGRSRCRRREARSKWRKNRRQAPEVLCGTIDTGRSRTGQRALLYGCQPASESSLRRCSNRAALRWKSWPQENKKFRVRRRREPEQRVGRFSGEARRHDLRPATAEPWRRRKAPRKAVGLRKTRTAFAVIEKIEGAWRSPQNGNGNEYTR